MEFNFNIARRNLILISIAIIIYNLAGGQFTNKLTLSFIGVEFMQENAEYIFKTLIIISFIWFVLRYWQFERAINKHNSTEEQKRLGITSIRRKINIDAKGELSHHLKDNTNSIIYKLISKSLQQRNKKLLHDTKRNHLKNIGDFHIGVQPTLKYNVEYSLNNAAITNQQYDPLSKFSIVYMHEQNQKKTIHLQTNFITRFIISLYFYIRVCIKESTFSSYVIPYIIASVAAYCTIFV